MLTNKLNGIANLMTLICFILSGTVLFVSGGLVWIVACILIFAFLFSDIETELSVLFFAVNLIAAVDVSFGGIPLISVLEAVLVIKMFILNKHLIKKNQIFYILLLCFLIFLSSLFLDYSVIKTIVYVFNLLMFGLIYSFTSMEENRTVYLRNRLFLSFTFGLTFSLIVALLRVDISTISSNVRFIGLWTDPNFIALFITINFCMIIIVVGNRYVRYLLFLPIFALYFYCGYLTYSRSFVYVMFFIALYAAFILLKNKNIAMSIKIIGVIFVLAVLYLIYRRYLIAIIESRGLIETVGRDWTNGRIDDWARAFKTFISSPTNVIFGTGSVTSHNTFFDFVLRFGLGVALLATMYIITIFKSVKFGNKMPDSVKLLYLILLFFLFSLPMLEDDITYLLLGCIPLGYINQNNNR